MFLCICHAVTEHDVTSSVQAGLSTPDEVADHTGASTGCGSCRDRLCGLVRAARGAESARTASAVA